MSNLIPWYKLPKTHPLRIRREFQQARNAYRDVRNKARSDADPSQWQIEIEERFGVRLTPSEREIETKRERYERKRAAWEAAGCPNDEGKRTRKRAKAVL